MNEQIQTFLDRLDEELIPFAKGDERFDMFLLGRAALILSYQFKLSTNDIDIVSMGNSELECKAIEILGKDSKLARTLGLYLIPARLGRPPGKSLRAAYRCNVPDPGREASLAAGR